MHWLVLFSVRDIIDSIYNFFFKVIIRNKPFNVQSCVVFSAWYVYVNKVLSNMSLFLVLIFTSAFNGVVAVLLAVIID